MSERTVEISTSVSVLTSPLGSPGESPLSFMMSRTDLAPQYSVTIQRSMFLK